MGARISVAMATYNGERYIRKQLDSIAAQTLHPFELVVCDDGSIDKTVELVQAFATEAAFPVRVIVNPRRLGYSDNFLSAAAACRGDWIAFSDQDDIWLPRKLQRIAERLECPKTAGDEEVLLVGHTSFVANEEIGKTGQRLPDFPSDATFSAMQHPAFFCVVGFSMAFDARLVRDLSVALRPRVHRQTPSVPPGHDQWIGMLANALGAIRVIAEPLAIWRRHDLSLTRPPGVRGTLADFHDATRATTPEPYALLSHMAAESAESFRRLADERRGSNWERRLVFAAARLDLLSQHQTARAALYEAGSPRQRMRAFSRLLTSGAYGGAAFSSLGRRALLKDLAFTSGMLGGKVAS